MNVKLKVEQKEKETYVYVEGELDAYTAPQLREQLFPLTEEKGLTIIVDLTEVRYMDSTGLGIFIGAFKSCEKHGNHLKLTGLTERIERLFDITGLKEIIDVDLKVRGEA